MNTLSFLFCYFKVFIMHIINGYGIATKVHYELSVFKYAHHVALLSLKNTCQHAQLYVVACKLYKVVAQKGYAIGLCLH